MNIENEKREVTALEIIKGLQICINISESCSDCPYLKMESSDCLRALLSDAKTLIDGLLEKISSTDCWRK